MQKVIEFDSTIVALLTCHLDILGVYPSMTMYPPCDQSSLTRRPQCFGLSHSLPFTQHPHDLSGQTAPKSCGSAMDCAARST